MHHIRSWARTKAHGSSPLSQESRRSSTPPSKGIFSKTNRGSSSNGNANKLSAFRSTDASGLSRHASEPSEKGITNNISGESPPPAPPPQLDGQDESLTSTEKRKNNVALRFYLTAKDILFSSYFNILLVFVPVGIAVDVAKLNPTTIFVMNAIAIVPLAGLLSHATESVAKRMGDTVGALMNITFGNAVELIIFIALKENEIRIVQASLLGSILANLLLILGMCFLVGGLRFREQIYNSTVTQMSACLLSLSVMSLLLPTAFHAAFSDAEKDKASTAVLQVSRGTSVILLLVYGMYLLFQLKSHAYMYESTPQYIIDEESAPGPVAAWMDSSSSDDDSSSSSDSDGSHESNTTAGRIKRVMRGGRRRRKSSAASNDTSEKANATRTSSYVTNDAYPTHADDGPSMPPTSVVGHRFGAIDINGDADGEGNTVQNPQNRINSVTEKHGGKSGKDRKRKNRHSKKTNAASPPVVEPDTAQKEKQPGLFNEPKCVDFAVTANLEAQTGVEAQKRPFTLRGMSIRPVIPTVFTQPSPSISPQPHPAGSPMTDPVPHVRYGIRRTNSLPDRLNQPVFKPVTNPLALQRSASTPVASGDDGDVQEENISRTTAVILLLISTGLVALCAEFMVSSINEVTTNTALGETFVGLIILPIVGNAAEHVTAVTVAHKNKMDLAIGVAVGSSIQIALFVTPLIVLLGWCMGREMSLYFTLFETVSLFVSAFIVNFLVLDGRSNYLEGSLLCAAYVIIAVAAFFYPPVDEQSNLGGNSEAGSKMIRSLLGLGGLV